MKATGTIFIGLVICASIGVLWYIGRYTVSVDAVPSLQEYMASSTADTNIFASTTSSLVISSEVLDTGAQNASQQNIDGQNSAKESKTSNKTDNNFSQPYQLTLPTSVIKSPRGDIQVFVAKNPTSREHGLSGYPALLPDQGMLFIFPVASTYSFWMKDMNFAIDIIWMNSDRKIVEISENVTPESFPKKFSPSGLVQFVLEVGAKEARKHGFEPGMTLMF